MNTNPIRAPQARLPNVTSPACKLWGHVVVTVGREGSEYLSKLGRIGQHHFVAATDPDHLPVFVEGARVYELLIGIGKPVRCEDVCTPELFIAHRGGRGKWVGKRAQWMGQQLRLNLGGELRVGDRKALRYVWWGKHCAVGGFAREGA